MTEKELATNNMSAKSSEVPTNQQQKEVETKLIIENKEFQIIPFKVESDDEYYIPEINLKIRKTKKGDWEGWSGGIGNNFKEKPFENLIAYAEDTISYWKKKIKELNKTWPDIRGDAGK
ncbi:MAG: hypothetical protein MRERV_58c011, partial [Mycoplasmataceae bacterium RV_VA103A]